MFPAVHGGGVCKKTKYYLVHSSLYYVNTLLKSSHFIYVLIKLRRICLPAQFLGQFLYVLTILSLRLILEIPIKRTQVQI